jgi:AcrR family transcriptional regulator
MAATRPMAEPVPAATGRGAERRRAIVAAAAELFAQRGYPAVGMDDIGAAAGVTGPAIYRHFDSKAAVLAAVFDGIIDAVDAPEEGGQRAAGADPDREATPDGDGSTGADRAAATAPAGDGSTGADGAREAAPAGDGSTAIDGAAEPPAVQLSDLVARYAAAVAQRRELMAVFVREVHHLPAEHAGRLRHRQRDLVARWRSLLAATHPGWPAEQVRTSVHAVFGMLNAVGTFASPLPDAVLAEQLTRLASTALELPIPRTADAPSLVHRG